MPTSADIDAVERDALLSADEQRQAAVGTAADPRAEDGDSRPTRSKAQVAKAVALHLIPLLVAIALFVLFFLVALPRILHGNRPAPSFRTYPAYLANGNSGAVATENGVCSQVGVDIMREKGGNAVDAAIAATLCIGTLNMFSAGIGGGGWAIVRAPKADQHLPRNKGIWDHTVVDFREVAPGSANRTMFYGRPKAAQVGGLSIGVPGELRGLEVMHSKWGTLPWAELIEPAAKLADEAKVSRELERRLGLFGGFMREDKAWKSVFFNKKTGELVKEGDVIRRPKYAASLRTVAKEGARALYVGPMAQALVRTINATGGIMTLTDLAIYKANTYPAIQGTWAGKKIYTTGAPTSGPALLSLLGMLEGFEQFVPANKSDRLSTFGGAATAGLNTVLAAHRFVEALKFAFGQRTLIGDPEYMSPLENEIIKEIPSRKRIMELRNNITDDRTHPIDYYHPKFDITNDHGTMSLSVVDKDGMAVSVTSTVNLIFGSRVMCPETGIILNDEMDDSSTPGVPNGFGLAPSPYNYPEPGKRPLSSMAPAIVEYFEPKRHAKSHSAEGEFSAAREGQHVFAGAEEDSEFADSGKAANGTETPSSIVALGGSGGSRIFGAVAQTLLHLDSGLDLSSAIERSRLHHQLLPVTLDIETGGGRFENELAEALGRRGHLINWLEVNLATSEVQGVQRNADGRVWGASDSRKQGVAVAY
ncbi:unnamed protein product [Tilletia controversa]|uniref:Glutathione hydrolase n=3 Tax=Tilletia TaxID=13289 RepID=A0A8X7SUR7_9BASI|nr:hypothetical protein CF336_g7107 [Tilletia laevis]KAE8188862.1 hypothetical protein CF328_g6469 [Tilletia controversa]KAE8251418.1 hypothetical protein A4X03_0g6373 [Tilletia caries]KAE8190367.1 hypothetical protein CF335_g6376 [Tilletia laevis]KAE8242912.1 hypothetical protein A4X06_0g6684 [Tilletia controversa]